MSQSITPFLSKTMLGLLVLAMLWPYLLHIWFLLREAFKGATDGERARQTAFGSLYER